jgi:nanoRNase/pAp phosphatase (c-di-AMP/oligoRNAs hydrolase)
MKCIAVCQTELLARTLDEALTTGFEFDVLVDSTPLAKRLHDAGIAATATDLRRTDTYLKADITPGTCVIIEDNGRKSLRKIIESIRDAGGTLVYVLGVGLADSEKREEELKAQFPELAYLAIAELVGPPLAIELGRSLSRLKVQQYQRYFSDADRVLILLHNDPDPDAIASGLALRILLRRTKQTAIIGALHGVTRPENQRMLHLLDIQIEEVIPEQFGEFDRVAMVDVQPHYFDGLLNRVDLVVDHHPEQSGYTAVFKDIRSDYGSTSTILTEHLRAVDANISERTATAMLYAIKSDTLFFNRQANREDINAFSYLYPLADATMIRKMEGTEITMERLEYVLKARTHGRLEEQVFCAFIGTCPREDLIPYLADFYLQLEETRWTIIAGIVNDSLVISVRNLGYSKNAGEFVRRYFGALGNAGGHRQMAKAVVPLRAFRHTYGNLQADQFTDTVLSLALEFLHESLPGHDKKLLKA